MNAKKDTVRRQVHNLVKTDYTYFTSHWVVFFSAQSGTFSLDTTYLKSAMTNSPDISSITGQSPHPGSLLCRDHRAVMPLLGMPVNPTRRNLCPPTGPRREIR